ncbi:MAG: LysM peptidoglycan-binding domain-containing protein [Thermoflavifilum sp.]|nr:LysM peptidoglycan-binding domain-containing protein [Thermoflavifilum sp.]MCL6512944.1 LysM peptidoglycan-binding domain-containing protein [Alicyclobacillus sp.]
MWIHTVSRGETLRDIAAQYGTDTRELLRLNELENPNVLVPGLHLLVETRQTYLAQSYTVRSGDTLDSLSARLGLGRRMLESWLGETATAALTPGRTILLPAVVSSKRTIEVNGYLIPAGGTEDANIVQTVRDLTYLCIFSYQARADGSLQPPRDDRMAREQARRQGIQPLMTVTNFDGNRFNTELAHTLLSNRSLRERLISNILDMLRARGFAGVNVDFEHMRPGDRFLYNQFIRELGERVRPAGYSISIAMGPKTSDMPQGTWMGAFDYRTLGQLVDFLMLMTYEWGWVGGPPMAIAPLDQVRAVLRYATSQVPAEKILMGIALYGYDWPLPYPTGRRASGISNNSAQNLALQKQVPIQWDARAASPYFEYSERGERHIVWFEDAMSVAAKFQLVYDFGLRGVSYWVLGNSFPQNWHLLREAFNVRRMSI